MSRVLEFEGCESPTVGVEWELQLLDAASLDLRPGIMPLMELYPGGQFVKPEFVQSCVELTTPVCVDSNQVITEIGDTLNRVVRRCDELGMMACGAGTHPFSKRLALITPMPRYENLVETRGILAQTQITFSTHVHIGMPSGDDAMRVMARLIPALPAFVALSANSPFWRGHDTGYVAYRHRILSAAPTYGLPLAFASWADFERFYSAALRSGTIKNFKSIHWDVRPHPDFGTLEIRVMDAAPDIRALNALVAFARVMVVMIMRTTDAELRRVLPDALPRWVAHENHFRAGQSGLDADYICDSEGHTRPLRDLVADLVALCKPVAAQIGEAEGLGLVDEILGGRTGYASQSNVFARNESMQEVVATLAHQLVAGGKSLPMTPCH